MSVDAASPEILGKVEAAELLHISTRSLERHVASHSIPHRRLGRRVLFSRSALEAWAAGGDLRGEGEAVEAQSGGRCQPGWQKALYG